ncbi:unnamed protein product [Vicia faba]|uniref:Uncharacterized protein n=1 Tax=Vicia faba TaxID=3906 RepID=A0AAV1ABU9_VICFA|nr:unnamed protein product [Vicia faba]
MSVAILLAEATLLPSIDLSLFSILIKSVRTQEQPVQQNMSNEHAQSQDALKSSFGTHGEPNVNNALNMKRVFMDAEESLSKVDSFSRWMSTAFASVDDLHMQSSLGIP